MATSGSQLTRSGPEERQGKAGIRVHDNITHLTWQWQAPYEGVNLCIWFHFIKHHQFLQVTCWQDKVFHMSITNLIEITLMVKQCAPDFPPEYWCVMCDAHVWGVSAQTPDRMQRGWGGGGECSNDSDADIGDKLYHRFCAVLREHPECKYCLAKIHPETSS